ncbi:carbon-nitrogen hydrolase family protein [Tindallia californiensis]|uniref:Predicted amidohydrolase n=1 Tax=Tindallia californiensis TaxID=159292 RepID=A0A1H3IFD7_9FIRM|nr:carbon-nitrogen hydrolase family protein [Tindallia californiensis]SDY26583.1 Predicted amidohydrolase [Tindallia californiensis]
MEPFRLSICQMMVKNNKKENLQKAEFMIRKAVSDVNSQIVVLPEIFNSPYSIECMEKTAEEEGGITTRMLSSLAKELKITLIGGSIAEKADGKIYNTSYTYNTIGKCIGKHRKIHLFDVDIKNGVRFMESDLLSAGNKVTVFDTAYGKVGIAICFDMRFPELIRLMALQQARIIIVPAAFNTTTGPAHWHETIKMRAVDNQVYFVAASPARNEEAEYHAYGHSTICDPWGTVLASTDEKESIVTTEILPDRVDSIRNQLPLLKLRRTDIYNLETFKTKK